MLGWRVAEYLELITISAVGVWIIDFALSLCEHEDKPLLTMSTLSTLDRPVTADAGGSRVRVGLGAIGVCSKSAGGRASPPFCTPSGGIFLFLEKQFFLVHHP